MSWAASAWAKKVKTGGPATKAVLLCLADYADERNSCYPGQELLAEETEQSVRTVRRHLERLEQLGLIRRESRFTTQGRRTSDRYVLAVGEPVAAEAETGHPRADTLTGGQSDRRSTETPPPDNGDSHHRTQVSGEQLERTTRENNQVDADAPLRFASASRDTSDETPQAPAGVDLALVDVEPDEPVLRFERRRRLPDDFKVTRRMREWFVEHGYAEQGVDGPTETEKFTDHFRGTGTPMLDWEATWRNWIRKAAERGGTRAGPRPSRQQQTDDIFERAAVRMGVIQGGRP